MGSLRFHHPCGAFRYLELRPEFLTMLKRLIFSISLLAQCCTSAMAQERQWSLDVNSEDAYLVFGVPESDDVGVSFWCTLRTGKIKFLVSESDPSLKPGTTARFTITADKTVARLRGKVESNGDAATTSLEAEIPASHPLFAALQLADRFRVEVGATEDVYPLIDADVTGLLSLCRKS